MKRQQLDHDSSSLSGFGEHRDAPEGYAPPPPAGESVGEMDYPKATVGSRILAYIVDGIIASVPMLILGAIGIAFLGRDFAAMQYGGGPGAGGIIFLILAGVIGGGWAFIYSLLRDGLGRGQSIGKRMTGLMVVRLTDNQPCGLGNSAVRNVFAIIIALAVSWIPILNFLGGLVEPVVALAHNKGYRLGDMVAKTQVIDVSQYRG